MTPFANNDELFDAFRNTADRIEKDGNQNAADELRNGFSGLNGLTDGWAMLMESIQKVLQTGGNISEGNRTDLTTILQTVKGIVHRR